MKTRRIASPKSGLKVPMRGSYPTGLHEDAVGELFAIRTKKQKESNVNNNEQYLYQVP